VDTGFPKEPAPTKERMIRTKGVPIFEPADFPGQTNSLVRKSCAKLIERTIRKKHALGLDPRAGMPGG
jgi:hypothetical protein